MGAHDPLWRVLCFVHQVDQISSSSQMDHPLIPFEVVLPEEVERGIDR